MAAPKLVFVVMIFMVSGTASIKRFHSIAGPFKVNLKRVEKCPTGNESPLSAKFFYQQRKRHGQPAAYSVNLSIPFMLDDTLLLKANLSSWSNNGGWKPNAFLGTFKTPCKLFSTHMRPQFEYTMIIFLGEKLTCPLYPGIYRVDNITIPENLFNSPSTFIKEFMYGRWLAEGRVYTKDARERVGCIRAIAETLPR